MKHRLSAIIPAIAIVTAGIVFLCQQHRQIREMKDARAARMKIHSPSPAKDSALPGGRLSPVNPQTSRSKTGNVHAAAFLTGFREKLRPFVESSERNAATTRARHTAGRIALLLGLDAGAKLALQEHMQKQAPAGIDAAARGWIAQHCSDDAIAKYDAAQNAMRTAAVEHEAQGAIFRLSRVVDLTPEQKDRLYAAFTGKAAGLPGDDDAAPYELRMSFALTDTPSIPNPGSLGRALLLPDQRAFFDAAVAEEKKAIAESTGRVMGQLMPALLGSLQEAAAGSATRD